MYLIHENYKLIIDIGLNILLKRIVRLYLLGGQ